MKKYILTGLLLSSSIYAQKNELTLHVLPSKINWSSPRDLVLSVVKNKLTFEKQSWGQVYSLLECSGTRVFVTIRPKDHPVLSQLFLESQGLGILYHSYEGEMVTGEQIQTDLAKLNTRFIKFAINPHQCDRMNQFFKEFGSKNVGRHFGLPHRPLFGEGASGASLGAAFVEAANMMDELYREEWTRGLNLPLEFSGPPLKDTTTNVLKLFASAGQWAQNQQEQKRIVFYDPNKMDEWIQEKMKIESFQCVDKKAQGVCINKTHLPNVDSPIWRQHTDPIYQKK